MRHLVAYLARDNAEKDEALHDVLEDILDTPVSPELLPAVQGEISQRTEDLVGPYELHDFFLYYMLRWGFPPRKIYRLALYALGKTYTPDVILKWLKTFYRRFFSQQFKRSCLPDGPKVGSAALSPRGDWRMPSDASAALWQAELETLESVHFSQYVESGPGRRLYSRRSGLSMRIQINTDRQQELSQFLTDYHPSH